MPSKLIYCWMELKWHLSLIIFWDILKQDSHLSIDNLDRKSLSKLNKQRVLTHIMLGFLLQPIRTLQSSNSQNQLIWMRLGRKILETKHKEEMMMFCHKIPQRRLRNWQKNNCKMSLEIWVKCINQKKEAKQINKSIKDMVHQKEISCDNWLERKFNKSKSPIKHKSERRIWEHLKAIIISNQVRPKFFHQGINRHFTILSHRKISVHSNLHEHLIGLNWLSR